MFHLSLCPSVFPSSGTYSCCWLLIHCPPISLISSPNKWFLVNMPCPTASFLSLFHWPHWFMLHVKFLSWKLRKLKPIWNMVFGDNKSSAVVHRGSCVLGFTPKPLLSPVLDAGKQERSHLQSHFFEDTSALVFNGFQLSCSLQSVNVCQDMNQLSFQGDMNGLQDRCCCAFLTFWKSMCNQ